MKNEDHEPEDVQDAMIVVQVTIQRELAEDVGRILHIWLAEAAASPIG